MGKRLNVYLNNYYENIFNEIKEELSKRDGVKYNNTDVIRIALITLKKVLEQK